MFNSFEYLVLAVVTGILVLVVMGILIARLDKKHKENRRVTDFTTVFGISPTTIENRTPGEQSVITRGLEIKAKIFFEKTESKRRLEEYIKQERERGFITEERILNNINYGSFNYSPLNLGNIKRLKNIGELISVVRADVEESKKDFWKSHGLAKDFFYITYEKIGDYKLFQLA